jgi:hypothetical protein
MANGDDSLFEVTTPIGFDVRLTAVAWKVISEVKHPVLAGRQPKVADTLSDPDEIRRSRVDRHVYLFYKVERPRRWLCVVAKRLNGDGFVITCYPTDTIKIGERIWTR